MTKDLQFVVLVFGVLIVWISGTSAAEPVIFSRDIAPILQSNCVGCHGSETMEGEYRVDSFAHLKKPGESKKPPLTPKDLTKSELFLRISSADESMRMPADSDPLPSADVQTIRKWIEDGAEYDSPDENQMLALLLPTVIHPDPPEAYPRTIPISALAIGKQGMLFASGYHEITVWNMEHGKLLKRIKNQGQRNYGIDLHPTKPLLAAASGTPGILGEVRITRLDNGEVENVLLKSAEAVFDCKFSPDGTQLAVATAIGEVQVYETENFQLQKKMPVHSDWVKSICWNADGTLVASASRDKTAKVIEVSTGSVKSTFAGHTETVNDVCFLKEGNQLASCSNDKTIHVWNSQDGKSAKKYDAGHEVLSLTRQEGLMIATDAGGNMTRLKLPDLSKVTVRNQPDWILTSCAGETEIITGSFDGQISIWSKADFDQKLNFIAAPGYPAASKE